MHGRTPARTRDASARMRGARPPVWARRGPRAARTPVAGFHFGERKRRRPVIDLLVIWTDKGGAGGAPLPDSIKGNDMKAPSLSAVREALAAHAPGITIRKEDCGEYRVTFTQEAIAAAFPDMTRAERIEKAESLASYDSDICGAYETISRGVEP